MQQQLTTYERTVLIGTRIEQLARGAKETVDTTGMTDIREIALKELAMGTIPMQILRTMPDDTVQMVNITRQ